LIIEGMPAREKLRRTRGVVVQPSHPDYPEATIEYLKLLAERQTGAPMGKFISVQPEPPDVRRSGIGRHLVDHLLHVLDA
jgi:hypothetical protein